MLTNGVDIGNLSIVLSADIGFDLVCSCQIRILSMFHNCRQKQGQLLHGAI